tara:strand:- start:42637 stop:43869 length:1233 start_codon:yes stop_codon:yes gene_type:complete
MNKEEVRQEQLLYDILCVQSESGKEDKMREMILKQISEIKKTLPLKEQKNFIVKKGQGNIYVTKGKIKKKQKYPCVVSHMDTVHDIIENYSIFETNGYFYAMDGDNIEQVGTGGDDKVGIFITLEMLRFKKNIKVAFFREEEVGCLGSKDAPKKFFKDCGYALQCDRQGHKDFVNSISGIDLYGDEFSKEIAPILEKYEREETSGGLTDVKSIKQKVDICVANMSCGYYEPHSNQEVVSIHVVTLTRNMVSELIDKLGCKLWKHKSKPKTNSSYSMWGGMYDGYYTGKTLHSNVNSYKCDSCNHIKKWNYTKGVYECDNCIKEGEIECPKCKEDLTPYDQLGKTYGWCWKCMIDYEVVDTKPEGSDSEVKNDIHETDETHCRCGNTDLEYHKSMEGFWCNKCNSIQYQKV